MAALTRRIGMPIRLFDVAAIDADAWSRQSAREEEVVMIASPQPESMSLSGAGNEAVMWRQAHRITDRGAIMRRELK
jgi:hypothetical protein